LYLAIISGYNVPYTFSQFTEIIQMKKVLVTGGAGFVGSFLCDRLIDEGHEVIAIDNFFTGSKENLSQLSDESNFELIRHDIVKPILLEVDWIFNLACPASPIHYQYNPVKTVKTNVMGTLNMLGLAKRVKARILQASTSEVYGDPQVHPQPESYFGNVNPIGLRSCYDEGKRVAETLMMDYHRQSQVDVKIVRIFNTYGPRMHPEDGRVVSNFIVAALKGEPITIHGDGLQIRSFCYVTELVDAMYRMMNTENFTGPVNTGNPGEFTMIELAETVLKMTNSSSKLVKVEARPDDPGRRRPDITLAKEKLGWEPEIKLKEGLKPTIEYFDELLKRS
jgi:UDP-glucuronate decarboxylase